MIDGTGHTVGFIEDDYCLNVFFKMVKEEGLAEEPEGGLRCSAEVVQERGFDYFGSAITLSKNKNSQCYCGCSFAAEKQGIDLRAVNKDAINYLKENNLSLKKEV